MAGIWLSKAKVRSTSAKNGMHYVACVASVSVQFRSKEGGARVKDLVKNGASKRAGWKLIILWCFCSFCTSSDCLVCMRTWFDPESLQGEKVVICGASKGIGEELAYQYMKFVAQLLLVTRQEAVLQKIVAHCGKLIGCSIASYM